MRSAWLVLGGVLAVTGCGAGTASSSSTSDRTPAAPVQASAAAPSPDSGRCDKVADDVRGLVAGTSAHTDRTLGGVELCRWESTQGPALGGHYFVQVTLADAGAFAGLSRGLDQSTSYMSDVAKTSPSGFDHATGFWNEPTHTFALLVEQGAGTVLLEGSAPTQPSNDALVVIAHALVG